MIYDCFTERERERERERYDIPISSSINVITQNIYLWIIYRLQNSKGKLFSVLTAKFKMIEIGFAEPFSK